MTVVVGQDSANLLLLRDDEVPDLVVSGLRDDLFVDQLVLRPVWPILNDLVSVGIANSRQCLQLIGSSRVEVDKAGAFVAAFFASPVPGAFWGAAVVSDTASTNISKYFTIFISLRFRQGLSKPVPRRSPYLSQQ